MNLNAGFVFVLAGLVSAPVLAVEFRGADFKLSKLQAAELKAQQQEESKPLELPEFKLIQQSKSENSPKAKISFTCVSAEGITYSQNDSNFEQCVAEGQLRTNRRASEKSNFQRVKAN